MTNNIPKQDGNKFILKAGDSVLECTCSNSGRITAFSVDGRNILTGATVNPFNFGSTFWTSPQSDWDWPPPKAADSEQAWKGTLEGDTVVLEGPPCEKMQLALQKRIRADEDRRAMVIDYTMKNMGDTIRKVAPWEISRVGPGGITFFPRGSATYPPAYQDPLAVEEISGITWFVHSHDTVTAQHKLFSDGRDGWIAHLEGGLLFLKSFVPCPADARAPGESEIEIYAVPEYVEVEQQGAYEPLAPGASRTWTVTWFLRKLPADLDVRPGSDALIKFIKGIISTVPFL